MTRELDRAVAEALGHNWLEVCDDFLSFYETDPQCIPEMLEWLRAVDGLTINVTADVYDHMPHRYRVELPWGDPIHHATGETLQEALARLVVAVVRGAS